MIYLFSRANHPGLSELAANLGASRLSRFDGENFWDKGRKNQIHPPVGSVIIPFGESLPELEDLKVLNARELPKNELDTYETLTNFNIKTVKAYPANMNTPAQWAGINYYPREFRKKIQRPKTTNPDYYVEWVNIVEEYVIHSFSGKSIRAGVKKATKPVAVTENDYNGNPLNLAHPNVRSNDLGWQVDHTFSSTPELRSIAHKATKVLNLNFAAVTIGKTMSGQMIVLNVGLVPDLTRPLTLKAYTKAIQKWISTPNEVVNATV